MNLKWGLLLLSVSTLSAVVMSTKSPLKRIREAAGLESTSVVIDSIRSRRERVGSDTTSSREDYIKLALLFCADGILKWIDDAFLKPEIPHFRRPNVHRDRPNALEFIRSWDDTMLQRQFRLERVDFNALLTLITPRIEVRI